MVLLVDMGTFAVIRGLYIYIFFKKESPATVTALLLTITVKKSSGRGLWILINFERKKQRLVILQRNRNSCPEAFVVLGPATTSINVK